jgi:hypothetical protein
MLVSPTRREQKSTMVIVVGQVKDLYAKSLTSVVLSSSISLLLGAACGALADLSVSEHASESFHLSFDVASPSLIQAARGQSRQYGLDQGSLVDMFLSFTSDGRSRTHEDITRPLNGMASQWALQLVRKLTREEWRPGKRPRDGSHYTGPLRPRRMGLRWRG